MGGWGWGGSSGVYNGNYTLGRDLSGELGHQQRYGLTVPTMEHWSQCTDNENRYGLDVPLVLD